MSPDLAASLGFFAGYLALLVWLLWPASARNKNPLHPGGPR